MGLNKQSQHHLTRPQGREDKELLDEIEANSAKEFEAERAKAKQTDHFTPVREATNAPGKQPRPAGPIVQPPKK